jgi:hypothetical protein
LCVGIRIVDAGRLLVAAAVGVVRGS